LIRTDRIGDLLMNLPALAWVRAAFPAAELTLLLQQPVRPLMEGYPGVDRLIGWSPDEGNNLGAAWRWGKRLRPERFGAAVVLNPTRLFHAACFLAGIPVRIGYHRKWSFLLNRTLEDTKAERELHESRYNLELVQLLGLGSPQPLPEAPAAVPLPVPPAAAAGIESWLQQQGINPGEPLITIHPWTSNPEKSWPLESFCEVVRRLSQEGKRICLIGGTENRPRMESLEKELPPGTIDGVGQVPLERLGALLKRSRLLISNDSGPAHIASAVGTPTIIVAPKTHERLLKRWRPMGDLCRLLFDPSPETVTAQAETLAQCGS